MNDTLQRKKDAEQRARVARNKREFVEKMLPWVDAFRSAPTRVPAVTEKGLTMHKSFGSLLGSVLAVFGKYGYKEFTPGKRGLPNHYMF
jgi:molecular chaperone GrpE (heat shock protein)